ncbi:MAG: hypothetical protein V3T84_04965 [Phycisphaerales bacterium]
MQIDVNAAADRLHLTRAQLTSVRSAQLNPNAPVSTDGRALTDLVSAPVKNISGVLANPSVSPKAPMVVPLTRTIQPDGTGTTSPTPRQIAGPAVDLKSSAQTLAKNPVVSDRGPAEPVDPIDALLADWGQSDSPYDFDGNGIVGANDLLMLLARLSGGGSPQPQEPHGDVAGPARPSTHVLAEPQRRDPSYSNPASTNDLDALLADWGQSDSPYDFDGNGIVGATDLLMLLARLSGEGSQQPREPHGDMAGPRRPSAYVLAEPLAQPHTPHGPRVAPDKRVAVGVNASTIAPQVIDDLAQNDSGTITRPEVDGPTPRFDRLDRHDDGVPSRSEMAAQIRDMLLDHIAMSPNANLHQFVREAMKRLSDHDNRNGAPGARDAAVQRSSRLYQQANLEATARQLVQRLTDQGATELRKFVQEGELSANEKRAVLDQIIILRPGAQSVNLVG